MVPNNAELWSIQKNEVISGLTHMFCNKRKKNKSWSFANYLIVK